MFEERMRALTQPAVHQKPVPWISEAPLYNCLSATSAGLFIFRARKGVVRMGKRSAWSLR